MFQTPPAINGTQWKDTLGESLALQDWAVQGLEVR